MDWKINCLPDSETTVLLSMPTADEPVWPGYHDGEQWLLADGMPAPDVNAWADMPAPMTPNAEVSGRPHHRTEKER